MHSIPLVVWSVPQTEDCHLSPPGHLLPLVQLRHLLFIQRNWVSTQRPDMTGPASGLVLSLPQEHSGESKKGGFWVCFHPCPEALPWNVAPQPRGTANWHVETTVWPHGGKGLHGVWYSKWWMWLWTVAQASLFLFKSDRESTRRALQEQWVNWVILWVNGMRQTGSGPVEHPSVPRAWIVQPPPTPSPCSPVTRSPRTEQGAAACCLVRPGALKVRWPDGSTS